MRTKNTGLGEMFEAPAENESTRKTWRDAAPDNPIDVVSNEIDPETEVENISRKELEKRELARAKVAYEAKKKALAELAIEKAMPRDSRFSPDFAITPESPIQVRQKHFEDTGEIIGELYLDYYEPKPEYAAEDVSWLRQYDPARYAKLLQQGRFDKSFKLNNLCPKQE